MGFPQFCCINPPKICLNNLTSDFPPRPWGSQWDSKSKLKPVTPSTHECFKTTSAGADHSSTPAVIRARWVESGDRQLLWITAVAATFHQRLRNYLLSPSFPFCRGREGWGWSWEGEWRGVMFRVRIEEYGEGAELYSLITVAPFC